MDLRTQDMIMDVPKADLPKEINPEVGMTLNANTNDGQPIQLIVKEIKENIDNIGCESPTGWKGTYFRYRIG